jgi:hypothetical protein
MPVHSIRLRRLALTGLILLVVVSRTGTLAAQDSGCVAGSEFLGAEPASRGLLLRFAGETAYRLLRGGSNEVGPGGDRIWWVVFDFPGATKKSSAEWVTLASGPVLRFRSALYRRESECGVRMTLELRRFLEPVLERRPEGYFFVTEPPDDARGSPRAGNLRPEPSGGVAVTGFVSSSDFGGSTVRSGSEGIGFYQEIVNGGWLRGFATHLFPERDGGGTFGGAGLFGIPLGGNRVDVAGGDVSIPYAAPSQDSVDVPGQILIRGGAASLRRAGAFRFFAFYGQSATPDTARLIGTPILLPEISRDRVAGAFGYATSGPCTFGGGWVRSLPDQGSARDNLFESLTVAFSESLRIGAVVEESLAGRSGWQTTVSPRLQRPGLFLGGYYRYASDGFLPALGSNFFAGLRRSFQLAGAAQLSRAFVVSGAGGQTRSFNLIDPLAVGTTAEFEDAALTAQLGARVNASLFFNSTASRSDAGAVNPADSRTNAFGVSTGVSTLPLSVTVAYSREETSDHVDPTFDFRSNRVTANLFSTLSGELRASAQASYADSRRLNGTSAGSNYSFSAALERRFGSRVRAGISGGEDVRPAGLATFGSTTTRLAAHLDVALPSELQFGGSYAYENLRTSGGPTAKGAYASLYLSKNFSWGAGHGPFADAGVRAFNLQDAVPDVQILGVIVVRAFLDRNGNGRPDSGEDPLEGLEFRIDEVTYRTDRTGFIRAWVPPGNHDVRFTVGRLAIRMSPAFPGRREAQIRGRETLILDSPFLSGGRIEGRAAVSGALPPGTPAPISGLLIRLRKGSTVLRETYTGDEGDFFFGNVAADNYGLEIAEGIPEDWTLEGELIMAIVVSPDAASRPVLTLRRKTARERFRGVRE